MGGFHSIHRAGNSNENPFGLLEAEILQNTKKNLRFRERKGSRTRIFDLFFDFDGPYSDQFLSLEVSKHVSGNLWAY